MVPFWLSNLMIALKFNQIAVRKQSQTLLQNLVLKYIIKLIMIAQDLVLLCLEISPKGTGG